MLKKSLIFIFMVTILQADYLLKCNMDGEIVEFFYKDSKTSKMLTNSEDGKIEIYHIDNNTYIVSSYQGNVNITDVNEMKAKAKEFGFDPSLLEQKSETPKYTIRKTGKREKIAGINGEEWIVKGKEDGIEFEEKVVVTNDKNVVKTMRSMFSSISEMSQGMGSSEDFFEIKKAYMIIKADGMKLESFSSKNLSSDFYKLPKATKNKAEFSQKNKRYIYPKETQDNSEISDSDVDKAVDMLKNFF